MFYDHIVLQDIVVVAGITWEVWFPWELNVCFVCAEIRQDVSLLEVEI